MRKTHHPSMRSLLWSRTGRFNILRKGASHFEWSDIYHVLLTLSWARFVALTSLLYVVSNTIFALVYLAGGDCIQNARRGSFVDAFFFSIQTMATIGYGAMYPRTAYANIVVTIEALVGLVGVAMITALGFARFSLPTARVLFSNVAIIAPYNRVPTLMFRTANERGNLIVEAQIRVSLLRNEVTAEGQSMRRFHDLKLIRSQTPIFALSWTVMHPIDEESPLYAATPQTLHEEEAEIVVMLTGLDETVSQTIHARHGFAASEILWNKQFVDIFSRTPAGRRCIDYNRFHDVTPL